MCNAEDLELKGLKLDLIDLVRDLTGSEDARYIPYMAKYETELEKLIGLPKKEQRKKLCAIADKVIT